MKGLVIKNTGSWYVVKDEAGVLTNCKVKGNFRLKGIRTTNPVAVGDRVDFVKNDENAAYITGIDERRNYIIRKASNLSKESQILAANLDVVFLVVTLKNPVTNTTFIDRFLATAEAYNVPAVIAVNKVDLLDEDDREYLEGVRNLYTTIGYEVVELVAKEGQGIEDLAVMARGKVALLAGNSGVGKSSIINALLPELNLRVGDVSASHHTGMHTTTFSEMFELPGGGYVIDTPGVKGFGTIDFEPSEVAHYFREIFKISEKCKYNNCTHTHEPGCAVRTAVENHYVSQSRYQSYLNILEDNSDDKYRKPF